MTSEYMFACPLTDFDRRGTHKQHAVSTRTAWLLENGDAMLSHRPLTPDFLAYLTDRLGLDGGTLTLLAPDGPPEGTFLDARTVLTDPLVNRLSQIVGPDWTLTPYLYDRTIATLADRLGHADAPGAAFFAQGGSDFFNSKSFFRAWATGTGVPVARGQVCRSRTATAEAVLALLNHTGSVIVKQDFSASGYGNVLFTTDPDVAPIGASAKHVTGRRPARSDVEQALAAHFPVVEQTRDFPVGLRPGEAVVEVYHPHSRTLYSELYVPEPPAGPELLDHGDMRMEPIWNGFAVPPVDLPAQAERTMTEWSLTMARTLQLLGYRGYLNCDSIVTPSGEVLFSEVNARIGGCTHVHAAARRLLGDDYQHRHTLLTRNDLPVADFAKLALAIDYEPRLRPDTDTGAVVLVDDSPCTGTVEYLVYGPDAHAAADTEELLRRTAETL
ncbi:peptide ligase PGM1-related protein [Streptomyces minutiscleroticus]|uniref:preATP grasp domain-containing protein n=1 Tax=Streptomyces minutiscleroticus TaxID=68238 RepID=UPI00332FA3BD